MQWGGWEPARLKSLVAGSKGLRGCPTTAETSGRRRPGPDKGQCSETSEWCLEILVRIKSWTPVLLKKSTEEATLAATVLAPSQGPYSLQYNNKGLISSCHWGQGKIQAELAFFKSLIGGEYGAWGSVSRPGGFKWHPLGGRNKTKL